MNLPKPPPPPLKVVTYKRQYDDEDENEDNDEDDLDAYIMNKINENIEENKNKPFPEDIDSLSPIDFSKPPSNELMDVLNKINICIQFYIEGTLKYKKGSKNIKCDKIMDLLFDIIVKFRDPEIKEKIDEKWYITPKYTKEKTAIYREDTSPLRKILQISYNISKNINLINVLFIVLITETIDTYNYLKEMGVLQSIDKLYGKKISDNYQIFLDKTFLFDKEGRSIKARERLIDETPKKSLHIVTEKKLLNPFAKGNISLCDTALKNCKTELKALYEDRQIPVPTIIESDPYLNCEENLKICKENLKKQLEYPPLPPPNIVTQEFQPNKTGGRKTRRKKTKRTKKRKTRGKYKN